MFKIAFLDDGIMNGADKVPEKVKKFKITNGSLQMRKADDSVYILSHGTMCFWIFSEYITDKDYILYDIQILNEYTSSGCVEDLICALQFCLDEQIDLINMSLGSTRFINEAGNEILRKLYKRGTYMVAAQNNNNLITYPACSPYVFGVVRDYAEILEKDQFFYINNRNEKIDIISHCEFSDIELKYDILMGKQNSFCAPYISALIFNELQKKSKREDILNFFRGNSVCSDEFNDWQYKKKNFPIWHDEINVPVVGVEIASEDSEKMFMEIVNKFRENSFHAVGVWIGEKQIDEKAYFFQFSQDKEYRECELRRLMKWVFNATDPDIIFLGHDYDDKTYFEEVADLILINRSENDKGRSKSIDVHGKNVEKIVEIIGAYFE